MPVVCADCGQPIPRTDGLVVKAGGAICGKCLRPEVLGMTPERVACEIWDLGSSGPLYVKDYVPKAAEIIAAAIREAVAAEREACAKIAASYHTNDCDPLQDYAARGIEEAIRARSQA